MNTIQRLTLTVLVGLALIIQLIHPSTAYADGVATPPPTDTAEVTSTPDPTEATVEPVDTSTPLPITDTPAITSTLDSDTPVPTDLPDLTSTPVPTESTSDPAEAAIPIPPTDSATEVAVSESPTPPETDVPATDAIPAEGPTLLEALDAIPGDTSLVVLDENGEPLPLATQEVVDIITTSDPMWCPTGVAPGGQGCTASYATMADLLANAGSYIDSQNANGTIWITSGYVGDVNPITIDGSVYANWATYALALQGGWNGISGDSTIGSNSIFSVPISIVNWLDNVTVNNITVSGIYDGLSIGYDSSTGAFNPVDGDVTINNSSFDNNAYFGAMIASRRNVTINNSSFYNNGYDGANISGGSVAITNSLFSNNASNGASIMSDFDVTVNNTIFSNNAADGASISSNNDVTVDNSTFSDNFYSGLFIWNSYSANIFNSTFGGNGLYSGSSGLYANTGDMNIIGVDFTNNYVGAEIHNNGSGDGFIYVDNSAFRLNEWDGLQVFAQNSTWNSVWIENSLFDYNNRNYSDGFGVWLVTDDFDEAYFFGNTFTNNFAGLVGWNTYNVYVDPSNRFDLNCIDIDTYNIFQDGNYCGAPIDPDVVTAVPSGPLLTAVSIEGNKGSFALNCAGHKGGYSINLLNGDLVELFCPISGLASISRLDNTTLPAVLPEGYTYASAFDVEITKEGRPINVIEEGGNMRASFVAPTLPTGASYAILYWDRDAATWIPLKDYLVRGSACSFCLHPEDPQDLRRILRGVLFDNAHDRVEVWTNFPGTFVLAKH